MVTESGRCPVLGVDASNIRGGGGLTHLVEVLGRVERPTGFGRVVLWGTSSTIQRLPERRWLQPVDIGRWGRTGLTRGLWQQIVLPRSLRAASCDLLWAPGGTIPLRRVTPVVTMFQNALPFEQRELRRFGRRDPRRLRYEALRRLQSLSMKNADGLILLSRYAAGIVPPSQSRFDRVIPHGVAERFFADSRTPEPSRDPPRLLYVSPVTAYKHQWHVAEAASLLRREGIPLEVHFVGSTAHRPSMARLQAVADRIDPDREYVNIRGHVPYAELEKVYHDADIFIFASSCENLPITLLEAMAARLPIACSKSGPMPEVLGDGGVYFDPEDASQIADAVRLLASNPDFARRIAQTGQSRARSFDWNRCASQTFQLLADVVTSVDSLEPRAAQ